MPRHAERRTLPYTVEQMFALVADVNRYPEFLPWCVGARITKRGQDEFWADLVIGFKLFREKFTSHVVLTPNARIDVNYIEGPLKHLHNRWDFVAEDNGCCTIDFEVDFEFKSAMFEKLVGAVFSEAVHHMVTAFVKRAEALYGKK